MVRVVMVSNMEMSISSIGRSKGIDLEQVAYVFGNSLSYRTIVYGTLDVFFRKSLKM